MKIRRIRLSNVAGYTSLTWDKIQPDLNFLLGRNGAGKSTLLQGLAVGLHYICGRRGEDVLTRTFPNGEIELVLDGISEPQRFRFSDVNKSQGKRESPYSFQILQVVENRQPKSTVGDGRNDLRQHAMNRYPNALSEIKFLMNSRNADESIAQEVLDICKTMTAAGSPQDWEWIQKATRERSPRKARPVSCGQFDIIALVLDLARLQNYLEKNSEPVFILLDNPETYLHPACQEPIVGVVRKMVPNAQLFITSHSLKLLCHREPKQVYWLSRPARSDESEATVLSIRELQGGAKGAFFDLYGDDVSSAVLALLTAFESPEYYNFLCMCAMPATAETRAEPRQDRQIKAVLENLVPRPNWTILDYGAGHGDLLEGLVASLNTGPGVLYIALDWTPSTILLQRIEKAKKEGTISSTSRRIEGIDEAPSACDAIVLLNVCHEILPPQLPSLLGTLIARYLRRSQSSKVVIHEVETLSVGEKRFIMWTPSDYEFIFGRIPGILVRTEQGVPPGVPLNTTIISFEPAKVDFDGLIQLLIQGFCERLPAKKDECIQQIQLLWSIDARKNNGFDEAMRQRRLAFYTAQLAALCLLEGERSKSKNG